MRTEKNRGRFLGVGKGLDTGPQITAVDCVPVELFLIDVLVVGFLGGIVGLGHVRRPNPSRGLDADGLVLVPRM